MVDISDANCVADLEGFLAGLNPPSIPGDVDGDGTAGFSDFLLLSANFGQPGNYTDGDIDRGGTVDFGDFLILSANFGQSGAAAASVPEPSVIVLRLAGISWLGVL